MIRVLGRHEILIICACFLIGYLYFESNRIPPTHHHHYEHQMDRLLTVDTRTNLNVLRAAAGLLQHYDELVRDQSEIVEAVELISMVPAYLDGPARREFADNFARFKQAVEHKASSTEELKSTHAALRGSFTYLPIVAEALVENLPTWNLDQESRDRLRNDTTRVITYMASGEEADHALAQAALRDIGLLITTLPKRVEPSSLNLFVTHSENILARKPKLDLLVESIVSAPTVATLESLRSGYRLGYMRASSRADLFERALYLCAALMLIGVATGMKRLSAAKERLAAANVSLEERVEVRTAELSEAKARLEDDGRVLQDLNEKLEVSYAELDQTRKDQLEVRDKFLSHVSHELRTPLTAVHQFVSLVLDGVAGEIKTEQKEFLEIAFRNVNQLTRMIADLMEVTRAQAGKLRIECNPIELGSISEEVIKTLESRARKSGVTLSTVDEPDLPSALADEERVRQILNNLIENAIKFTPEGGSITVSTAANSQEGTIRMSVRDTGYGIAAENLERVFDQLHQESSAELRSRKGLGLGLSICKELVERQGGRIWVESAEGVGSTFHFTLPQFQLAQLITGAVTTENGLRDEFSLLRIEIQPRSAGNLTDGMSRFVRHKLLRLMYSESDVLLPRMQWESDREQFWIVATTGAVGAAAMVERIGEKLAAASDREAHELVFEIDSWVFDVEELSIEKGDTTAWIDSVSRLIYENNSKEQEEWTQRRSSSSMTMPISGSA